VYVIDPQVNVNVSMDSLEVLVKELVVPMTAPVMEFVSVLNNWPEWKQPCLWDPIRIMKGMRTQQLGMKTRFMAACVILHGQLA
jgi:hypothetical protein